MGPGEYLLDKLKEQLSAETRAADALERIAVALERADPVPVPLAVCDACNGAGRMPQQYPGGWWIVRCDVCEGRGTR